MTAAHVVVAINPGDREEVGELPEENDQKQAPRFDAQPIGGGGPTNHGRQCAGDRADRGIEGRQRFQRGVHQHIERPRRQRDDRGQAVHAQRQHDQPPAVINVPKTAAAAGETRPVGKGRLRVRRIWESRERSRI